MIIKLSRLCFVVFLLGFIGGCATTAKIYTFEDNVHPYEKIALSKALPAKTWKFKTGYVKTKEIVETTKTAFANSIQRAFPEHNLPRVRFDEDFFDKTVRFLDEHNQAGRASIPKSSVDVDIVGDHLIVRFLAGEYMSKYNRSGIAAQEFIFPITQYEKGGFLYISVAFPDTFKQKLGNIGSQAPVLPLFDSASIESAISLAYQSIDPDRIQFSRKKSFKGEFTSPFPDDSVYANYQRKAVLGTNEKSVKKVAKMEKDIEGFNTNIEVAVYPYRGVSKIIYNASLSQQFYLSPNGETNFKHFPKNQTVESMLVAIANE